LNGIAPNIFFPTLAIFTKRDGEGGIRLFAAQLPMSVATQLKKPCQSAAVRQGWRGDLEQSDARGGVESPEMIKKCLSVRGPNERITSEFLTPSIPSALNLEWR
jgi:hypothetical protein